MEWQLQINLIKANTELFSRDDTSDRYAPALYEVDVPLLVPSSPYYGLVPACAHLLVRNGLVNKFLGLIPQK